jgi:hypothetical protein
VTPGAGDAAQVSRRQLPYGVAAMQVIRRLPRFAPLAQSRDMDGSQIINLGALLVALTALTTSTFFTWRVVRLTRDANHVPIIIDLLAAHRDGEFRRKEERVWQELPECDVSAGLSGLSGDLRYDVFEVIQHYQAMGYISENGIVDGQFLASEIRHSTLLTWSAAEPLIQVERQVRGGEFTFLNAFERFAALAQSIDPKTHPRPVGRRRSLRAAVAAPRGPSRRTSS